MIADAEVGPWPDEYMSVASALVDAKRDGIFLAELDKGRIDRIGQNMEQWDGGAGREKAPGEDDFEPANPVRQPAEENEERRTERKRGPNENVSRQIVQPERDREEKQGVELASIPNDALPRGRAKQRQQDVFIVRPLETR